MQQPRPILEQLIQAIVLNLPAFEAAEKRVQKGLQTLLKKYVQNMQSENFLRETTDKLILDTTVTPTLAVPMSILIFMDQCYYGLLCDNIGRSSNNTPLSKEDLLIGLKAISDKNKLEILSFLKEKSSYNLELAKQLNLTPATISHHMNTY
nr:winged helix-turn-helix domain-containing protein [Enterococcus sp. 665A]